MDMARSCRAPGTPLPNRRKGDGQRSTWWHLPRRKSPTWPGYQSGRAEHRGADANDFVPAGGADVPLCSARHRRPENSAETGEDLVDDGAGVALAGYDKVGTFAEGLHEEPVAGRHRGGELGLDAFGGAAPFTDVAVDAAGKAELLGSVDEDAEVQPFGDAGYGEQQDAVGHHEGSWIEGACLVGAAVGGEVVDGYLDRPAGGEVVEVLQEEFVVE